MTYYYTYKVFDDNFQYIGVRKCECHPFQDNKYWGSSTVIKNREWVPTQKEILAIFNNKKDAYLNVYV